MARWAGHLPSDSSPRQSFSPPKPLNVRAGCLSINELQQVLAKRQKATVTAVREPHSRWLSSPKHDMNEYLQSLESVWPHLKPGNSKPTRQRRSQSAGSQRLMRAAKTPVVCTGADGPKSVPVSSSENSFSRVKLTRARWLQQKREQYQAHADLLQQGCAPVPIRHSETADCDKDPEYGLRKGQALRGKKKMGSCVMMFKPSGGTLFKLRGMRFDLIRSHLIKYGIIINQKFIQQAQRVFQLCVRQLSADMNQFDRVMRRLGIVDVYVNDRIFKCFDVDGSGAVDYKEFCLGLTAAWKSSLADKMVTYFAVIDQNGDGMLGRDEIEDILIDSNQWEGDVPEIKRLVNLIFDAVDPHGTGEVNKEKFLDGMVSNHQVIAVFDKCFGTATQLEGPGKEDSDQQMDDLKKKLGFEEGICKDTGYKNMMLNSQHM